jgi:heme-degrading monooxygenase HmoA
MFILWKYDVKDEFQDDFVRAYRPGGTWSELFELAHGFVGVQLLKGEAGTFLTIDEWRSAADFDAFMTQHHHSYQELDRRTEGWTRREDRIGNFQLLG